jgi:hypothetical protein
MVISATRGIMFFAALILSMLLATSSGAYGSDLHVVKVHKGDTLLELCHRYLESPGQCRRVARLNRLRNPDLILPGQELVMPAELLKSTPVAGLVSFIKGTVVQESPGQGARQPLLANAPVQQGMRIYTGKESSVEITYDDGTSFYLRPESSLSLVRSRKLVDSSMVRDFFLHTGEIINRIRRATGEEQRYNIRTPSAVAGARGTVYKVAVDPAETTRSGVLQGKIAVSAMEQTVTVKEGEGSVTPKGSPPLPPRRLLPPPVPSQLQQIYRSDSFQIRVSGVEEAAAMRVMLTRDAGMKDVVREGVIKPGDPFDVTGLADGIYWLQALSIDQVGIEGAFSPPVTMEVRANPLPPNVQEPADGSSFTPGDVSFQWLKVADAAEYHLQVGRDSNFSDRVVDLKSAEVNAVAKGLDPGNFFFRLSSVAADGYQGEWSNTLGFKVTPPPPPPPTPGLEPPVTDKKEMRIRVREAFPGLTYHFQVAKNLQFAPLLLDETRDGPELVFPRPEEPGVYYVRSRCGDSKGKYGAFSTPQSFEIKRSFPYGYFGAGLGAVGVVLLLLL